MSGIIHFIRAYPVFVNGEGWRSPYDTTQERVSPVSFKHKINIYDKDDNLVSTKERVEIQGRGVETTMRSDNIKQYLDELGTGEKLKVEYFVDPFKDYRGSKTTRYVDIDDFTGIRLTVGRFTSVSVECKYYYGAQQPEYTQQGYGLHGIELEEVDLNRLKYESNIDTIITSKESGAIVRGLTVNNSMEFDSKSMRIGFTDFVEHIRNDSETIKVSMVLTDIWEDGKIDDEHGTHRDKELEKLKNIYENDEIIKIESNLTHDIYGDYEGRTKTRRVPDEEIPNFRRIPRRSQSEPQPDFMVYGITETIQLPRKAKIHNAVIESLEVQQSNISANCYFCELSIKKLNFVENDIFFRYPTELSEEGIKDGEINENIYYLNLVYEEEEEEDEDEYRHGNLFFWSRVGRRLGIIKDED